MPVVLEVVGTLELPLAIGAPGSGIQMTRANTSDGSAHNTAAPAIILNKIIFVGA